MTPLQSAGTSQGASALYLYEDARARRFEPFALTRPIATLVAGTAAIWQRWRMSLQLPARAIVGCPALVDFEEAGTPGVAAEGVLPAGSVLAHARFAPAIEIIPWRGVPDGPDEGYRSRDADASRWIGVGGDRTAAVRLARDVAVEELATGQVDLADLGARDGADAEISGWWQDEIWDFIRLLPEQLADDIRRLRTLRGSQARIEREWTLPAHATVVGDHAVVVHGSTAGEEHVPPAIVEPHVVFDATAGPIYVGHGSHIHAFTRLVGPCYIGSSVTVLGGDIAASSLGSVSKVRGEMTNSVVLGYSNKGHDGFVGHSYVGRWVNLGAGTVTRNLKNTYGAIALWTPDGVRDTGLQFVGTLFGDHVKTGIGLRLTTGTVLGAGANIYDRMPPKVVSPFSWGGRPPYSVYRVDKFLETAERMMSRRHVSLSDRMRRHLMAAHANRWTAESDE